SGYLRVRPCLDALRREAEAAGAVLRHHSEVRAHVNSSESADGRPGLVLADGSTVQADRIVVAAGALAAELLPAVVARRPLTVLRRVLAWTDVDLRDMPCWAAFAPEGFFYGFPGNDEGVGEGVSGCKLACHIASDPNLAWMNDASDPRAVEREIQPRDLAPLEDFIARYFPAAGKPTTAKTCLYTNSESGDFCIDLHPEDERVVIAAGFSGHGFKFAPIIGEILADLSVDGRSELCLPRFRIARS
ncbi:MAG: FAD-dependent oxidoreductase, partial [Myxococcales bacterium]|nr:FAD-dependent oxidoreductase [Myxococcales bacterium]